jgi:crossover junction endodeoxyribonuclease RusA
MKLTLPYPISTNDMYGEFIPKGGKRAVKFLTPAAKAYQRNCGWIAKQAGCREPTAKLIDIVRVVLHPRTIGPKGKSTGARMDLDNVFKVALDALKGVVYVDDRQIHHIGDVEYGEPTDHGALVVEIKEFIPRALPLFEGFPDDAASREIFKLPTALPPKATPAPDLLGDPF